ncbi:hypothetical protein DRJ17_05370 [Candidatus Woesearchaeota archaeon]|nr:MAG: hypothetical protein DRJ17_05370 [Candidatus Woesearchaeota archaeon]
MNILSPYPKNKQQAIAVDKAYSNLRSNNFTILADDVGTGKTFEALATIHKEIKLKELKYTLVIIIAMQKDLRVKWCEDIKEIFVKQYLKDDFAEFFKNTTMATTLEQAIKNYPSIAICGSSAISVTKKEKENFTKKYRNNKVFKDYVDNHLLTRNLTINQIVRNDKIKRNLVANFKRFQLREKIMQNYKKVILIVDEAHNLKATRNNDFYDFTKHEHEINPLSSKVPFYTTRYKIVDKILFLTATPFQQTPKYLLRLLGIPITILKKQANYPKILENIRMQLEGLEDYKQAKNSYYSRVVKAESYYTLVNNIYQALQGDTLRKINMRLHGNMSKESILRAIPDFKLRNNILQLIDLKNKLEKNFRRIIVRTEPDRPYLLRVVGSLALPKNTSAINIRSGIKQINISSREENKEKKLLELIDRLRKDRQLEKHKIQGNKKIVIFVNSIKTGKRIKELLNSKKPIEGKRYTKPALNLLIKVNQKQLNKITNIAAGYKGSIFNTKRITQFQRWIIYTCLLLKEIKEERYKKIFTKYLKEELDLAIKRNTKIKEENKLTANEILRRIKKANLEEFAKYKRKTKFRQMLKSQNKKVYSYIKKKIKLFIDKEEAIKYMLYLIESMHLYPDLKKDIFNKLDVTFKAAIEENDITFITNLIDKKNRKRNFLSMHECEFYYGKRREMIRTLFNTPFNPKIIILPNTAQEGLDFQRYSNIAIHYDLHPSSAKMEQRIGRVDRKGNFVRDNYDANNPAGIIEFRPCCNKKDQRVMNILSYDERWFNVFFLKLKRKALKLNKRELDILDVLTQLFRIKLG